MRYLTILCAALLLSSCTKDSESVCISDTECEAKAKAGTIKSTHTKCYLSEGLCGPASKDGSVDEGPGKDSGPSDASDAGDLQAKDVGPDLPDQFVADKDTRKDKGDSCTSGAECKTGKCIDDVCCDHTEATCGDCKRCNVANNLGDCVQKDTAAEDCVVQGEPSVCSGSCSASGCVWPTDVCTTTCAGSPATQLSETLCKQGSCNDKQNPTGCTPAHTLCLPSGSATGGACAKGCTQHTDCAGTHPLCDRTNAHAHPDGLGLCVDPANVTHVPKTTTAAALQTLIQNAAAGTWLKLEAGNYTNVEITLTGIKQAKLAGDGGTVELSATASEPVFKVTGDAKLTLQGVSVLGNNSSTAKDAINCNASNAQMTIVESSVTGAKLVGINAIVGCSLTLRRSTIDGNKGGGLNLQNGTFIITNTLIIGNGTKGASGSALGGVNFGTGSSVTFEHNTVLNNLAKNGKVGGIACDSLETIAYSILDGNTFTGTGDQSSNCTLTQTNATTGACSITAQDRPATSATACLDQHTPPINLALDRAGGPRLKGAKADLGCYEVQ